MLFSLHNLINRNNIRSFPNLILRIKDKSIKLSIVERIFFKHKVRKEPSFTFYSTVITSCLSNRRRGVIYLVICCIVTSFFAYEIKKSLSGTLAIRNHDKKMK